MKKTLIILSTIIAILLFASFVLPKIISIPIAYYNSQKVWEKLDDSVITENKNDTILKFPKQIGYVNDYGNVFTKEQISELENIIRDYEKATTNEISVVSTNSIKPYKDISLYTTELANQWGIGKAEKDNGLIILFSKNLRSIRISTGYGTEKILTDEKCKKIIDKTIIPEFKNGKYHIGIKNGIKELIAEWK
jgi:uncharacterized protein